MVRIRLKPRQGIGAKNALDDVDEFPVCTADEAARV